ncbi:MAG TPA: hypothetical protein DIU20_14740 [Cryomorphaceae bacterium]|nr:hypothetical protein [Cryomorphaceae bacterium]
MHEDLAQVLQKLQQHPDYPALFEKAFGSDSITSKHFLYSLAQFMSMMVSANSKFDRFLQDKAILSPAEQRGYELFKINCAHCHTGALTSDFSYRNNGLDIYSEDAGRARITLKEEDHGKFKVPSLRNVALSTPYMHDGRFESLQEVINHYSEGIQATTNLDPSLAPMHFSEEEKADLVLFLTTLTDEEYTQHTELSDPSVLR